MAKCKHKIGFLSLRDCRNPVNALCGLCNKPVCSKHYKVHNDNIVCFDCLVSQSSEDEIKRYGIEREYRRHQTYNDTGFFPYYFGSSMMYGNDDYRYFDANKESAKDNSPSQDDAEANDSLDPDNFLDS
ncbi:hypothetical protein MCHI_003658 [Candidatus Magnetoovum chiemensis]|nr:hypothetical protein MCHI_003658 [Candidatus Magnetoovum chiemensis]